MNKELEQDLTFGETISNLRKKNDFTKKEVAEYVGCSQTYIADIEKKKKIPGDNIVLKLAELFKYDRRELLFLAKRDATVPEAKELFNTKKKSYERDDNVEPASMGKLIDIPLLSWVQAGEMTGYDDRYPYPGCSDEYISTDIKGEHLFALRVKGESMSPKFLEGDIVIVNPDAQVNSGDFIVVKDMINQETMLKQLKKYSNNLMILHPLNPSYKDIEFTENYIIIGRIVRKQTNL